MTIITLPKILRERLTEEGADAFVQILDKIEDRAQKATLEIAEERFERRLSEEINKLRSDIIRWMFLFWIGQAVTVIGFMLTIFKK